MARNFGGEMRLTIAGLGLVKMSGEFTIDPTRNTVATVKNFDGTHARVHTLRNYKANFALELPVGITAQMLLDYEGTITIVEETARTLHVFANGGFVGEPTSDRANGRTTGLSFESDLYREQAA
jgi:hypothetical protein